MDLRLVTVTGLAEQGASFPTSNSDIQGFMHHMVEGLGCTRFKVLARVQGLGCRINFKCRCWTKADGAKQVISFFPGPEIMPHAA